jgi:hypothetical protein
MFALSVASAALAGLLFGFDTAVSAGVTGDVRDLFELSGINAILYYLNDIFSGAGLSSVSSDIQAVTVGATNFVFTVLAMFCIDRLGRRRLLLIGAVAWPFA